MVRPRVLSMSGYQFLALYILAVVALAFLLVFRTVAVSRIRATATAEYSIQTTVAITPAVK
jgi:hypothetical protein